MKMKMVLFLLAVLLVSRALAAPASAQDATRYSEGGITFDYPKGWKVKTEKPGLVSPFQRAYRPENPLRHFGVVSHCIYPPQGNAEHYSRLKITLDRSGSGRWSGWSRSPPAA